MKNKLYTLIKYLAAFGVLLAIYLLYEQYTLPSWTPCYVNSVVNCDAIISGQVAKTFGIPTPLIGLIGYVVIFFSALKQKAKLLMGMATFGLVFCLWIGYVELFILHTVCPVCIMCQLTMISVFTLSILVNKKSKSESSDSE